MPQSNINIDTGLVSLTINGDKNKVISFNPSDFSIITRINQAYKDIEKFQSEIKNIETDTSKDDTAAITEASSQIEKLNNLVREKIDYIFNSPVSDVVFGNTSPLALVKGIPLYERFLTAVMPVIKNAIEEEKKSAEKRILSRVNAVKDYK